MRVWRFILLACVSGEVVTFISSFVSRAAEDATEQKWSAPASEAAKKNPIASIQSFARRRLQERRNVESVLRLNVFGDAQNQFDHHAGAEDLDL